MHFLKETDFTRDQVRDVLNKARVLKRTRGSHEQPLSGQSWAMLFSKSSTRTRVSFEVGIRELGGHPLYLSRSDIHLGRGESVADTARVLSRYVHGMVVRTFGHHEVEELAAAGSVPVVNALTDFLHPCQIYADAFTMAERWAGDGDLLESLRGRRIAFIGDTACNMANSWILGAAHFGMSISLAGPAGFEPGLRVLRNLRQDVLALQLISPSDFEPAGVDSEVVLVDSEGNGESRHRITPALLGAYRQAFDAHCAAISAYCERNGWGHVRAMTDAHIEALVLHALRKEGLLR